MTRDGESGVVRKSVRVQTPIERAFSVFVEQMETWWPARTPHRRKALRINFRRTARGRPLV